MKTTQHAKSNNMSKLKIKGVFMHNHVLTVHIMNSEVSDITYKYPTKMNYKVNITMSWFRSSECQISELGNFIMYWTCRQHVEDFQQALFHVMEFHHVTCNQLMVITCLTLYMLCYVLCKLFVVCCFFFFMCVFFFFFFFFGGGGGGLHMFFKKLIQEYHHSLDPEIRNTIIVWIQRLGLIFCREYCLQRLSVDDFVYVPVNNFSVMSGWVFLGWTSPKQRIGEAWTRELSILPLRHCVPSADDKSCPGCNL